MQNPGALHLQCSRSGPSQPGHSFWQATVPAGSFLAQAAPTPAPEPARTNLPGSGPADHPAALLQRTCLQLIRERQVKELDPIPPPTEVRWC